MSRDFDGVDDVITGTVTAIDTGDWTIGGWVNPDTAGELGLGALLFVRNGSFDVQQFRFNTAAGVLFARQRGTTNADAITTNTLPMGAWSCIFATFRASDGKCRIFIGDLDSAIVEAAYSTQTVLATRSTGGATATIGNNTGGTVTFDGRIALVPFDAREWTLDEMEAFRLGAQPITTGALRFFCPLDSPTAAQAEDLSGSGVAFTVTGALVAEDPPIPSGWGETQSVLVVPDAPPATGASGAREFDGIDDKIEGTITAIDTGDWTIGGWVNPDNAGEGSAGIVLRVDHPGTGSITQKLRILDANLSLRARQGFATTDARTDTTTVLTAGQWQVVFVTFRASDAKCRIFIGDLDSAIVEAAYAAQDTGAGTRGTGGTRATIGNFTGQTATWDGRIALVPFDAREWTLDEMEAFRLGAQPITTGALRFFCPLDSPTAAQAEDLSGSGVAFTVTGATVAEGPPVPRAWATSAITVAAVGAGSPTATGYGGLESVASFDLVASTFSAELVDAGAVPDNADREAYIVFYVDASNELRLRVTNGQLQARKKVAGIASTVGTPATYNATTHRFLRLREAAGTTFWEYRSASGAWTTLASEANPITLTQGKLHVKAGNILATTATTVKWDNIGIDVPAPAQSGGLLLLLGVG